MNLKREKINFIVCSPLIPIVNGIRSTATNLILELNQICDLYVILIMRENVSYDETPSFLKTNNIAFSEINANSGSNLYSLSEKMKMLFPYYLRKEKTIAKRISLICKNETALYFGTSFDPIAYHIAKELKTPFFFPADSIVPDLKNTAYLGVLALFCTVGLYVTFAEVLKKIPAFTVNLTFNLEPVYAIIMAF